MLSNQEICTVAFFVSNPYLFVTLNIALSEMHAVQIYMDAIRLVFLGKTNTSIPFFYLILTVTHTVVFYVGNSVSYSFLM